MYGLSLAKALIESGQAKALLLITADTYSKIVNPADKSVRTLFGDGAAAALIVASEESTLIGPFVLGTDGGGGENIIVRTGGKRQNYDPSAELTPDDSGNARTVNDIYMNGSEVFNFTLRMVPELFRQTLDKGGVKQDEVDMFVFHQANCFMLDHLRRKLEIPAEQVRIGHGGHRQHGLVIDPARITAGAQRRTVEGRRPCDASRLRSRLLLGSDTHSLGRDLYLIRLRVCGPIEPFANGNLEFVPKYRVYAIGREADVQLLP